MTWRAEVLWPGDAAGQVLRLDAPISFWGGICPTTAKVVLAGHPQHGQGLTGKICVIPDPIGSSSSSAVLLELLHSGIGPAAIILGKRDAILPIGVVVADEMSWPTIPVMLLPDLPAQTGQTVAVCSDGVISLLAE